MELWGQGLPFLIEFGQCAPLSYGVGVGFDHLIRIQEAGRTKDARLASWLNTVSGGTKVR